MAKNRMTRQELLNILRDGVTELVSGMPAYQLDIANRRAVGHDWTLTLSDDSGQLILSSEDGMTIAPVSK